MPSARWYSQVLRSFILHTSSLIPMWVKPWGDCSRSNSGTPGPVKETSNLLERERERTQTMLTRHTSQTLLKVRYFFSLHHQQVQCQVGSKIFTSSKPPRLSLIMSLLIPMRCRNCSERESWHLLRLREHRNKWQRKPPHLQRKPLSFSKSSKQWQETTSPPPQGG